MQLLRVLEGLQKARTAQKVMVARLWKTLPISQTLERQSLTHSDSWACTTRRSCHYLSYVWYVVHKKIRRLSCILRNHFRQ